MKLPELPFLKSKSETLYILVLLLRQEKANAVIIEKTGSTIRIVNQHEEFFSTNLEDAGNEEWLDITDAAITRAEETLPPNIETHQTVFGLPNSWVEEKQIKKEYLSRLKHASDELDLKPIGFIEIPEAIIHQIGESEGAPVSAVLAEIGKKYVVLTLARAGRIIQTKTAPIKESSVHTVDALLKEFNVDVLPSRVIIYNGAGVNELSQNFTHHHWSKSIPFLHMPQILLLEKGFDVEAVVAGAAAQLGASMHAGTPRARGRTLATVATAATVGAADGISETEDATPKNLSLDQESAEAFGFVVGKDIEKLPKNETVKEEFPETEAEITVEETGGHAPKINDPYESAKPLDSDDAHRNLRTPDPSEHMRMHVPQTKKKDFLNGLTLPPFLANLSSKLPNGTPKNRLFIFLPVALVLLIVLAILYVAMLKANVEIVVRPEVAEEEADVVFATSGSSDFSDNVIAAKTTTVEIDGKATTKATGEEEEGEKAKGTVTIFNSSQGKKELAAGTVISSSNNLDFVLDKEVIIASASGDIFSGIKSGTAKVPVTASEIGKESNIPSNTEFKIGNDSALGAKNDEAFSGGSKEEILVVSKADLAKLAKDLPESLKKQAEDQINQKLGSKEILLTVYADYEPSASDYSAKEGAEADSVTLESTVEFIGVFYDNAELAEYTKTLLSEKLSDDLTLDEKDIKTTITDIEEDDGDYKTTLLIEVDLLPKLDTEKITDQIKGKSFAEANKIISDLPQVISSSIKLFPPLPFISLLPRQAGNITIVVTSND